MASSSSSSEEDSKDEAIEALARHPCPTVHIGENDRLRVLVCNYLALGQFELARCCLSSLYKRAPGAALGVLDDVILVGPPEDWLCSDSIPSSSHLSWMCSIVRHELHGVQMPQKAGSAYAAWRFASLEFDITLLDNVKRTTRDRQTLREGIDIKPLAFTQAVRLRTAYFELLFHAFPGLSRKRAQSSSVTSRGRRRSIGRRRSTADGDLGFVPHMTSFMPHLTFYDISGFAQGAATCMRGQTVGDAACSVAEVISTLERCVRNDPNTGRELWRLFMSKLVTICFSVFITLQLIELTVERMERRHGTHPERPGTPRYQDGVHTPPQENGN